MKFEFLLDICLKILMLLFFLYTINVRECMAEENEGISEESDDYLDYLEEIDFNIRISKRSKKSKRDDKYESSPLMRHFIWKGMKDQDVNDIPHTWLKEDDQTLDDNLKAEEYIDSNNEEFEGRHTDLESERIKSLIPNCEQGITKKIVNGQNAAKGEYPWIVVIVRFGQPICAGSIIHKRWIVTAAHCFMKNRSKMNLTLKIGSNEYNSGKQYKVSRIIMHPRFNALNMFNSDICLLKTVKPIQFNAFNRPICLPEFTYSEPKSKSVSVAGWGAKAFSGRLLPIPLQKVSLDIISSQECLQRFKQKKVKIYRSQLCTWTKGKDSCRGDSGGPAVEHINGRAVLVGVISYGITCADEFPGIYTKTSYFLKWISETIRTNLKIKKDDSNQVKTNEDPDYYNSNENVNNDKADKRKYQISWGAHVGGQVGGNLEIKKRTKLNQTNKELDEN